MQKILSLIEAVRQGDVSQLREVIFASSNVDEVLNEALKWAGHTGRLEIAQYALGQGADITSEDYVAFRFACLQGNIEMVRFLVEHGADIHANENSAIITASELGQLEVVDYLIAKGDWQTKDEEGLSQLEKLAAMPKTKIVVAQVKAHLEKIATEQQRALLEAEQKAVEELKRHAERMAALQVGAKPFVLKRRMT